MSNALNFYRKKLENGMTILFEKRNLPVIASAVSVKFGAEFESEKLKGVSHFIEHLVFKGTKKRNAEEISAEIEKRGGILNAFTSEEITCFWDKLSRKYLDIGLEIISDLTLNPTFNPVELEKERKVVLEEIKMYYDSPQMYVLEKIKELLYAKPFGMFTAGTNETMSQISREDVLKTFNNNYATNNMIFSAVGNANFDDICETIKKTFPNNHKKTFEIKPIIKNGTLIEKRSGIEQTNLVFGYHAPKLCDKNRYAAEIFDIILAGGMSSRLFQEIREKRGLAYAIKGILEQDKNYGYEMLYAGTTKEKMNQVKELIIKEIKNMAKLEKKDLEEAKEQLIGLRNVESESSEQVMRDLILEENAGNAGEYYEYEKKLAAVKLADVQNLAKLKNYSFLALIPNK